MRISEYLLKDFSPFKCSDTAKNALQLCNEYGISHIPIVEKENYIGCIPKEALIESHSDEKLSALKHQADRISISSSSAIFEAIHLFYVHNTTIIPVFDQNKYQGYLLQEDVMAALSKTPFISEPGAIIIVEIPERQYALSEVTKIVESNNNQLFGAICSQIDHAQVQILIKISSENLSSVSETFERFGYRIVDKFFHDEQTDFIEDRYHQLMKYMNI